MDSVINLVNQKFDDAPLKEPDFKWLCLCLILFIFWFLYVSFIHGRVCGAILSFLLRKWLKKSHLSIGAMSFSLIKGKLMLKDVIFTDEDQTIRICYVIIIFNYWTPYENYVEDPGVLLTGPAKDSNRCLSVHVYGLDAHVHNRFEAYKLLKRFTLSPDHAMSTVEDEHSQEDGDGVDAILFRVAKTDQQAGDEQPAVSWRTCRCLFAKIRFSFSVAKLCVGNNQTPRSFVASVDKLSGFYTTRPPTLAQDNFQHYISGMLTRANFSLLKSSDCRDTDIESPPSAQDDFKISILRMGQGSFEYIQEDPGLVAVHEGEETWPRWELALKVNREFVATYGPWVDRQRDLLWKFFYPSSYEPMEMTVQPVPGQRRIFQQFQFNLTLEDKCEARVSVPYLDQNHKVQSLVICGSSGSQVNFTLPWITTASGYVAVVKVDLTKGRLLMPKHVSTTLLRGDSLSLTFNLHYSRFWNSPQRWDIEVGGRHNKLVFLYDQKNMFRDLINDWSNDSRPDLLHFVPFTYNFRIKAQHFDLILVANDYNWVSPSPRNSYLSFHMRTLDLSIQLPFTDFLQSVIPINFQFEISKLVCRISLPTDHTNLYNLRELHANLRLVNKAGYVQKQNQFEITTEFISHSPREKSAENVRSARSSASNDSSAFEEKYEIVWVDCWRAPTASLRIVYAYHPQPVCEEYWRFLPVALQHRLKPQASEVTESCQDGDGSKIRGPTGKQLLAALFDPSYMDADMVDVHLSVPSSKLCVYGALLRLFLHVKENYLGIHQVPMSTEKGPMEVGTPSWLYPPGENEEPIESNAPTYYTFISDPSAVMDPRHFRPLAVRVTASLHNIQAHLPFHARPGSSPCPTAFIDCISFEMDKRYKGTRLQVVVSPVLVCVYDDGQESRPSSNAPLAVGRLQLTGLQFRGHAMFSQVGLPLEAETLEYAWLMELTVGSLSGQLTSPQLASVVQVLSSFVYGVLDPENNPVDSRNFAFCQHGRPQAICTDWEVAMHKVSCPTDTQLKYKLLRVSVDAVQLALVESGACLSIELTPIRFSDCNLHGRTKKGGVSVLIPKFNLIQYVRRCENAPKKLFPNLETPVMSSDHSDMRRFGGWFEAGSFELGPITMNAGLAPDHLEEPDWRDQFLHLHDNETKRLWFIWSNNPDKLSVCGCYGGCEFFGENLGGVLLHDEIVSGRFVSRALFPSKAKYQEVSQADHLSDKRSLRFGESLLQAGKLVFELHNPAVCMESVNGLAMMREETWTRLSDFMSRRKQAWRDKSERLAKEPVDLMKPEAPSLLDDEDAGLCDSCQTDLLNGVNFDSTDEEASDWTDHDSCLRSKGTNSSSDLSLNHPSFFCDADKRSLLSSSGESLGQLVQSRKKKSRNRHRKRKAGETSPSPVLDPLSSQIDINSITRNIEEICKSSSSSPVSMTVPSPRRPNRLADHIPPTPPPRQFNKVSPQSAVPTRRSTGGRTAELEMKNMIDLRGQLTRPITESSLLRTAYARHLRQFECVEHWAEPVRYAEQWKICSRLANGHVCRKMPGCANVPVFFCRRGGLSPRTLISRPDLKPQEADEEREANQSVKPDDEMTVYQNMFFSGQNSSLQSSATVSLKGPINIFLTPLFVEAMDRYLSALVPVAANMPPSLVLDMMHLRCISLVSQKQKPVRPEIPAVSAENVVPLDQPHGNFRVSQRHLGQARRLTSHLIRNFPQKTALSSRSHRLLSTTGMVRTSSTKALVRHSMSDLRRPRIGHHRRPPPLQHVHESSLNAEESYSEVAKCTVKLASLSVERVNLCFLQLYAIEDVVNLDTMRSGLKDLSCVSLMTFAVDGLRAEVLAEEKVESQMSLDFSQLVESANEMDDRTVLKRDAAPAHVVARRSKRRSLVQRDGHRYESLSAEVPHGPKDPLIVDDLSTSAKPPLPRSAKSPTNVHFGHRRQPSAPPILHDRPLNTTYMSDKNSVLLSSGAVTNSPRKTDSVTAPHAASVCGDSSLDRAVNQPPKLKLSSNGMGSQRTLQIVGSLNIGRIHGQLRRLTRESEFSGDVLLTAIPFAKSRVFFAYDTDPQLLEPDASIVSRYPGLRPTAQVTELLQNKTSGWIMFECGMEQLTLSCMQRNGFQDSSRDTTGCKTSTESHQPSSSKRPSVGSSATRLGSVKSEGFDSTKVPHTKKAHVPAHQSEADESKRNAFLACLKVNKVWLSFPAPKRLPNKRRVELLRSDWNLLSTAAPMINAWIHPTDRLTTTTKCLRSAFERRVLSVTACLMIQTLYYPKDDNETKRVLYLCKPSTMHDKLNSFAKALRLDASCQMFTELRRWLLARRDANGLIGLDKMLNEWLYDGYVPDVQILQCFIYLVTREWRKYVHREPIPDTKSNNDKKAIIDHFGGDDVFKVLNPALISQSASNVGLGQPGVSRSYHDVTQAGMERASFHELNTRDSLSLLSEGKEDTVDEVDTEDNSDEFVKGLNVHQREFLRNNPGMNQFLRDAYACQKTEGGSESMKEQPLESMVNQVGVSPRDSSTTCAEEDLQSSGDAEAQVSSNPTPRVTTRPTRSVTTAELQQMSHLKSGYAALRGAQKDFLPLLEAVGLNDRGIRRTTLMKKFGGYFSADGVLEVCQIDILKSVDNPLARRRPGEATLPRAGEGSVNAGNSSAFLCQQFSSKITIQDVIGLKQPNATTTNISVILQIDFIKNHVNMPLLRLTHQFVTMAYLTMDTRNVLKQKHAATQPGGGEKRVSREERRFGHRKNDSVGSSDYASTSLNTRSSGVIGSSAYVPLQDDGSSSGSFPDAPAQVDSMSDRLIFSRQNGELTQQITGSSQNSADQDRVSNRSVPTPPHRIAASSNLPDCWKRLYSFMQYYNTVPELKSVTRRSTKMPTIKEEDHTQRHRRASRPPPSMLSNHENILLHGDGPAPPPTPTGGVVNEKKGGGGLKSDVVQKIVYPWLHGERIPVILFVTAKVREMEVTAVIGELKLNASVRNVRGSFSLTKMLLGHGTFTNKVNLFSASGHCDACRIQLIEGIKPNTMEVACVQVGRSHVLLSSNHKTSPKSEKNVLFCNLGRVEIDLPHHPVRLHGVMQRQAKRISSTVSEFLRISVTPDMPMSSTPMEPTSTPGASVGPMSPGPTEQPEGSTTTSSQSSSFFASGSQQVPQSVRTRDADDGAKALHKLSNATPPFAASLTAIAQGLTINVALHPNLKAVYKVEPVYFTGKLGMVPQIDVSLTHHSLSFNSIKDVSTSIFPGNYTLQLPRIFIGLTLRRCSGGSYTHEAGDVSSSLHKSNRHSYTSRSGAPVNLTQGLTTEEGLYLDIQMTVAMLEETLTTDMLNYSMVVAKLFAKEINELIQKMSNDHQDMFNLPEPEKKPIAVRKRSRVSVKVNFSGIRIMATTINGAIKLETREIVVDVTNRISSDFAQSSQHQSESWILFVSLGHLSLELGHHIQDLLYHERMPEFKTLAFFRMAIAMRSLLADEVNKQWTNPAREHEAYPEREAFLINVKRPICCLKPASLDRAILLMLAYKSELAKWKDHLTLLSGGEKEEDFQPPKGLIPRVKLPQPATPQQQMFVFQIDVDDIGFCLPTNLMVGTGLQAVETDSRAALVLTLGKSRISACFRDSLVSEGEFTDFCLRFDDDFLIGSDDWNPDRSRCSFTVKKNVERMLVMNACTVPKGSFRICWRAPEVLRLDEKARWFLAVQWRMRGLDVHMDTEIGTRFKNLFATLTNMTGYYDDYVAHQYEATTRTEPFDYDKPNENDDATKEHISSSSTQIYNTKVLRDQEKEKQLQELAESMQCRNFKREKWVHLKKRKKSKLLRPVFERTGSLRTQRAQLQDAASSEKPSTRQASFESSDVMEKRSSVSAENLSEASPLVAGSALFTGSDGGLARNRSGSSMTPSNSPSVYLDAETGFPFDISRKPSVVSAPCLDRASSDQETKFYENELDFEDLELDEFEGVDVVNLPPVPPRLQQLDRGSTIMKDSEQKELPLPCNDTVQVESSIMFQLDVNIHIDSGRCVLHPKLEAPQQSTADASDPKFAYVTPINPMRGLSELRPNLTRQQMTSPTAEDRQQGYLERFRKFISEESKWKIPVITLFNLPAVDVLLYYSSRTQMDVSKRADCMEASSNGSPLSASNRASLDRSTSGPGISQINKVRKQADLYASCSLQDLPDQLVVNPALLDFLEQALENIPLVDDDESESDRESVVLSDSDEENPTEIKLANADRLSTSTATPVARANKEKSEKSLSSIRGSSSSRSSSHRKAYPLIFSNSESFPVDVVVCISVQPSKILFSCLPTSHMQCLLALPNLDLVFSTTRQMSDNGEVTIQIPPQLRRSGFGDDVLETTAYVVAESGLSVTATLKDFSISVFHTYSEIAQKTGAFSEKSSYSLTLKVQNVCLNMSRTVQTAVLCLEESEVPCSPRSQTVLSQGGPGRSTMLTMNSTHAISSSGVQTLMQNANTLHKRLQFSGVFEVGVAKFNCDLRRTQEILELPKAWYRKSLAKRLFLGYQGSSTTASTENPSSSRKTSKPTDFQASPSAPKPVTESQSGASPTRRTSIGNQFSSWLEKRSSIGTLNEPERKGDEGSVRRPSELPCTLPRQVAEKEDGKTPHSRKSRTTGSKATNGSQEPQVNSQDSTFGPSTRLNGGSLRVTSYEALPIFFANLRRLEIEMFTSSLMGYTQLAVDQLFAYGSISIDSSKAKSYSFHAGFHCCEFASEKNIVGIEFSVLGSEMSLRIKEDQMSDPEHSLELSVAGVQTRWLYSTDIIFLIRLSRLDLALCDSWCLRKSNDQVVGENGTVSICVQGELTYDHLQLGIARDSATNMRLACEKICEFFVEQFRESRNSLIGGGLTFSPMHKPDLRREAEAPSREDKEECDFAELLQRHWQKPMLDAIALYARQLHLNQLGSRPLNEPITPTGQVLPPILGASLQLSGGCLSLAMFAGALEWANDWAVFNLQQPQMSFETEAQRVQQPHFHRFPEGAPRETVSRTELAPFDPCGWLNLRQVFTLDFCNDARYPTQKGFVVRVKRGPKETEKSPENLSIAQWMHYIFSSGDTIVQGCLSNIYPDQVQSVVKMTSFDVQFPSDEKKENKTATMKPSGIGDMIFMLPSMYVRLVSDQQQPMSNQFYHEVKKDLDKEAEEAAEAEAKVDSLEVFTPKSSMNGAGESKKQTSQEEITKLQEKWGKSPFLPQVWLGFHTYFHGVINLGMIDVPWLPSLISSYLDNLPTDQKTSASPLDTIGQTHFALVRDTRHYHAYSWELHPQFRWIAASNLGVPALDHLLERIGFRKARVTIPKLMQRGMMDLLDKLTADLVNISLQLTADPLADKPYLPLLSQQNPSESQANTSNPDDDGKD